MSAINPCCCIPLQRGIIIMAIIDIVLDTMNFVLYILALLAITAYRSDYRVDHPYVTDEELTIAIVVCILAIFICFLGLCLSIRLYHGAKYRDIRKCRFWLIVKTILLFLSLLSLITNSTAGESEGYNMGTTIPTLVYRVYMIYCVYCFIQELKIDQARLGFSYNTAYQMHDYNNQQQQQQQPTIFVTSATPTTAYPPYPMNNDSSYNSPPPPYPTDGPGINNPNHQYNYAMTNNV